MRQITYPNDLNDVKQVFLDTFSKEPWLDDWRDNQLEKYLEDLLTPNNALCFGLFLNDNLIGIALGRLLHFYDGKQFRIDEFCISPTIQGKGYGSIFIHMLSEQVHKKNVSYLLLDTQKNYPAYDFYQKNGFIEVKNSIGLIKRIK